ncbi:hypothetical protein, partial [Pseudomonas savastanoi]|uniref:hypothetical protein n=1 Tax=Pseudomonas savastanoi TaxID=29438 RepID=UPI001C802557
RSALRVTRLFTSDDTLTSHTALKARSIQHIAGFSHEYLNGPGPEVVELTETLYEGCRKLSLSRQTVLGLTGKWCPLLRAWFMHS